MKNVKGITLIALLITIIILLILSGIAISSLTGSGLFSKAEEAKEKTIKAQLKEEIEMAIQEIQIEELPKGNIVTLESLANGQLVAKLTEITADLDTDTITGEYKDYDYTITGEYEVIIGNKLVGEKPTITHTVDTEQIGVTQVEITVNASVNDGTIVEIIKPDGSIEENVGQVTYTVNKSGKYTFIAKSSNGRKASYTVKITNILPSAPVIEAQGGYPVLTVYGVQNTQGKVMITYDDSEGLINSYSEDNGATWKEYTGPFEPMASNIIAKSEYREDSTIKVQSQKNVILDDAMPPETYDEDLTTYGVALNKCLLIDEGVRGYTINLDLYCPQWNHINVKFYLEDKATETGNGGYWHTTYGKGTLSLVIPENAKWLKVVTVEGRNDLCYLYDIALDTVPIGDETKLYTYIDDTGVHNYNKYRIKYFDTAVEKLYSKDNVNWVDYPQDGILLENGETIYAKSVDIKGNESDILTYTNNISKIGSNAFDGDNSSYFDCLASVSPYYIYIDPNVQGKKVYFKFTAKLYSDWRFNFYNSQGEVIDRWPAVVNGDYENENLTIPKDATKLEIIYNAGTRASGRFYEMKIIN